MDSSNYGKKYDLNPSATDIDTSRTGAKYDLTGGEVDDTVTGPIEGEGKSDGNKVNKWVISPYGL